MASIKYKVYKNTGMAGMKNKFYARAFHDETIDIAALAEHMSNHNTPYSRGTIHGVLKDMVACIRELLLDSKKVKLDNLAIFSLGLQSRPADTAADFTPSANIVKAYINALGTGDISKKQLDISARFKEMTEYSREASTSGGESGGGSTPTPATYTITLLSANEAQGSVSGGGTYADGEEASIVATPASGYLFDRWSDGDTNATRTITVTADLTLTAAFKADEHPEIPDAE